MNPIHKNEPPPLIWRAWAMPSPDTFTIPPIAALLARWLHGRGYVADPFARNSTIANITNDLNPETSAQEHLDAREFLANLQRQMVRVDGVLFDPPYSPRQISEVYQQIGRECSIEDTQNARLYRQCRDLAAQILRRGGVAISCGWNSGGFGIERGFIIREILIVAHGGAHNDTIVTVETYERPGSCADGICEDEIALGRKDPALRADIPYLLQRLTELTAEREHWESILSDHQLALTEARDELKAAQQTIASLKDVLCTLHDAVVRHGCNETDSWPATFKAQMDALHTTQDLLASIPAGLVPGDKP